MVSIVSRMYSVLAWALFVLAFGLPGIAVTARRLHDTDRSGWLQLIALIPVLGTIVLFVWCAQDGREPNRFGARTAQIRGGGSKSGHKLPRS